jgi:hypothetical protein
MFTLTPDSEMPHLCAASAMLCPSSFTASMEHRIFSGSRCISRFRSYVLSASTLSSCAMIVSASSIGTSEIDARLRRRKSISL